MKRYKYRNVFLFWPLPWHAKRMLDEKDIYRLAKKFKVNRYRGLCICFPNLFIRIPHRSWMSFPNACRWCGLAAGSNSQFYIGSTICCSIKWIWLQKTAFGPTSSVRWLCRWVEKGMIIKLTKCIRSLADELLPAPMGRPAPASGCHYSTCDARDKLPCTFMRPIWTKSWKWVKTRKKLLENEGSRKDKPASKSGWLWSRWITVHIVRQP